MLEYRLQCHFLELVFDLYLQLFAYFFVYFDSTKLFTAKQCDCTDFVLLKKGRKPLCVYVHAFFISILKSYMFFYLFFHNYY